MMCFFMFLKKIVENNCQKNTLEKVHAKELMLVQPLSGMIYLCLADSTEKSNLMIYGTLI